MVDLSEDCMLFGLNPDQEEVGNNDFSNTYEEFAKFFDPEYIENNEVNWFIPQYNE